MPMIRLLCQDKFGRLAHMCGDEDRHFSGIKKVANMRNEHEGNDQPNLYDTFSRLTKVASSNASASFAFPNWTNLRT